MKVRVIKNSDGTISVIHPAPKSRRPLESEEQWLNRVFSKATPQGAVFLDVNSSSLPKTREYRDAWEIEDGKVKINKVKSDNIKNKKDNEINSKKNVLGKLKALGLTEDEIKEIKRV